MNAIELSDFGFENLRLAQRAEPRAHGDQVVVRVHAVSLNFRDLAVVRGHYNPGISLPLVPGSDGAGEVVAVGPDVTRFKVGDRVTTMMTRDWISGRATPEGMAKQLGTTLDGVLQDHVMLPERAFVTMPKSFSYEQAATLPIAALTAWTSLQEGEIKHGDTVLVQGTGGVSLFALQLAKARGARVVATTSREARISRLRELGADEVFLSSDPNWGERVFKWTGGRGVDLVVDIGGPSNFAQSINALRVGGFVSAVGFLGGSQAIADFSFPLLLKNIGIRGIQVGSRLDYEALVRALDAAPIAPVIDRVFALREARAALEYMASGNHVGKVVISLD